MKINVAAVTRSPLFRFVMVTALGVAGGWLAGSFGAAVLPSVMFGAAVAAGVIAYLGPKS